MVFDFSVKALNEVKNMSFDNFVYYDGAWAMISPQVGSSHELNLIVGSDLGEIKKRLKEGADHRDVPLYHVDWSAGLAQFGSGFIRGVAQVNEETHTYSRKGQPWLEGDGVYLFNNIEPALAKPDVIVEFFRGLSSLRKLEVDKNLFSDDCLIDGNISMCIICTQSQYEQFVKCHNSIRPGFNLMKFLSMSI